MVVQDGRHGGDECRKKNSSLSIKEGGAVLPWPLVRLAPRRSAALPLPLSCGTEQTVRSYNALPALAAEADEGTALLALLLEVLARQAGAVYQLLLLHQAAACTTPRGGVRCTGPDPAST